MTTNVQLNELCKNIPYFKGVFMREQIKDLKLQENECFIYNINTSDDNETNDVKHWNLAFKKK